MIELWVVHSWQKMFQILSHGESDYINCIVGGMLKKAELKEYCLELLLHKIQETTTAMQAAQDSANSEEKSSMGDKYETGRAMSQLERDRIASQLYLLQQEYQKLLLVDASTSHAVVQTGALVQTENQWYWIAVSLGQVSKEADKIMVVSPLAPISKAIMGQKKGSVFSFNGKNQKILGVF